MVSPFVCGGGGLAAGIVIDRYLEPWGTRKWVGWRSFRVRSRSSGSPPALRRGAAGGAGRHGWRVAPLSMVGHGSRRSGLDVTETGEPGLGARGRARDAGVRTSEGFGRRRRSAQVSTRFVLDLTEISDGKAWHPVSGRANTIVIGDRREIEAGQPSRRRVRLPWCPPLESRGIRLSCVSPSRGNSAAVHGRRIGELLASAGRAGRRLRGCWAKIRSSSRAGWSSDWTRRSRLWLPRSSWASARGSSPRSMMPSREPGQLIFWRYRASSSRHCVRPLARFSVRVWLAVGLT